MASISSLEAQSSRRAPACPPKPESSSLKSVDWRGLAVGVLSLGAAAFPKQTVGLIGYVIERAGNLVTARATGLAERMVSYVPSGCLGAATRLGLFVLGLGAIKPAIDNFKGKNSFAAQRGNASKQVQYGFELQEMRDDCSSSLPRVGEYVANILTPALTRALKTAGCHEISLAKLQDPEALPEDGARGQLELIFESAVAWEENHTHLILCFKQKTLTYNPIELRAKFHLESEDSIFATVEFLDEQVGEAWLLYEGSFKAKLEEEAMQQTMVKVLKQHNIWLNLRADLDVETN